jgi:hypothetical protein
MFVLDVLTEKFVVLVEEADVVRLRGRPDVCVVSWLIDVCRIAQQRREAL